MRPERSTIDPAEVERFARLAETWWDPRGEMKPLHALNPVRVRVIRDAMIRRFGRDPRSGPPFEGLRVLDVGCGGGLACEPLARLGAEVVGIDPAAENVGVARAHAASGGLAIDYRATTAEALLAAGETFDAVLALEVVEHVADVPLFLETCAGLARPGGLLILATINRTAKAFALAIVGAEYVLGWLPRGTHAYDKLVRPEELSGPLRAAGLTPVETVGIAYDPFGDRWRTSSDTDVNYVMVFGKDPSRTLSGTSFRTEIEEPITRADPTSSGLLRWDIDGRPADVGTYANFEQRISDFVRNVDRLRAGEPYRPNDPDGFREIHRQLDRAGRRKARIEVIALENVEADRAESRKRELLAEYGLPYRRARRG